MKPIRIVSTLLAAFSLWNVAAFADPGVPADYPLKKCPVSQEEYGSGGMVAVKVTHEGTDVWLCCKSCVKKFNQTPAKFAQAVKDAAPKK